MCLRKDVYYVLFLTPVSVSKTGECLILRMNFTVYKGVIIILSFILVQVILKNPQKRKSIHTEAPLFKSLKNFTFRSFSQISHFYVDFMGSAGVTAWMADTLSRKS